MISQSAGSSGNDTINESMKDKEKIHSCLSPLQDLTTTFRKIARFGVTNVFNTLVKPRLRTLFVECFVSTKYIMTEEELNESEFLGGVPVVASLGLGETTLANIAALASAASQSATTGGVKEGAMKRFTSNLGTLLKDELSIYLTPNAFVALCTMCVEMVVQEWERVLLVPASSSNGSAAGGPGGGGVRFNAYGAVRLDKDVRFVSAWFSDLLPFGSVRDKFVRMSQLALLVNLEHPTEVLLFV
jgi:hypothetical protein